MFRVVVSNWEVPISTLSGIILTEYIYLPFIYILFFWQGGGCKKWDLATRTRV